METASVKYATPTPIRTTPERKVLTTSSVDFWLLGGASILLYGILFIADQLREDSAPVALRLSQIAAVFGALNIICNYPHFIISYKFGYGRGLKFILQHWVRLLAVPTAILALFAVAYTNYTQPSPLGILPNFGSEMMSVAVWIMFLTVGWHYSKQVFGCVMVYGRYTNYPISKRQRLILKLSVFSVALHQLISYARGVYEAGIAGRPYYSTLYVAPYGLPDWVTTISWALVGAGFFAVVGGVFLANYRSKKVLPDLNMVVPWIAFYIWWAPFFEVSEFSSWAIPFFHSLQYLPFAYRMETSTLKKGPHFSRVIAFRTLLLFLTGFLAFELLPSIADTQLHTELHQTAWFFTLAAVITINIHHFFIDSVVWKFDQKEVRESLFGA